MRHPSPSVGRDACLVMAGAAASCLVLYWLAARAARTTAEALAAYEQEQDQEQDQDQDQDQDQVREQQKIHQHHHHQKLTSETLASDPIIAEQLTRNVQFFGEGQKKISDSFVVVVGLGGVGSHCAHMLLRGGVGRLRIVDFDQITLSSLNRHCLATREDVGTPKSACLEKYFARISPETAVEALNIMYRTEVEAQVLGDALGAPDFVVDAIDNIDTKIELLAACHRRGLPVLAVAGAGAKADPTRLTFVDLAESTSDPLARSVRARLRKMHGITTGIPVLMSTERPRCGLVTPLEAGETDHQLEQYQLVPNFRIRTIPVLGTTPSAFGMAAAGFVLCELAGQPIEPRPVLHLPGKSVETQYNRLEARLGKEPGVDLAEVEVLVREIWRGESARAIEPRPLVGVSKSVGNLHLTVWDPALGDVVDNLILLTEEEADAHDECVARPGGFDALRRDEPDFVDMVERRLARARRDFKFGYF